MSFLEERMDVNVSRGSRGSPTVPGWTKDYLPSGQLVQNFTATMLPHKYDVARMMQDKAGFEAVMSIFYVVFLGHYEGFRFKDWLDFECDQTNSSVLAVDGDWQLQRAYTFGSVTVYRNILKPVDGTVTLYTADGDPLEATVDPTTGLATVTGTPATWEGEFDVPVQFVKGEWYRSLEVNSRNPYTMPDSVELEELTHL